MDQDAKSNAGQQSQVATKQTLDGATFRVLWVDSQEYKALKKFGVWVAVVTLLALIGVMVAFSLIWSRVVEQVGSLGGASVLTLYLFGTPIAAAFLIYIRMLQLKRLFNDRLTSGIAQQLQSEEGELAAHATDGQLELASLWAATQKRIHLYHTIATSQAEQSFKVGQRASIAGFILVIGLGLAAAFATSGTASIAAAAVGVAGAAMSGYIGATFMKAQSEASAQLRQFFLQPVEFSRLLGAERLLNTLPDAHKAEAVQLVVRTMMPVSENSSANQEEKKDA